MPVRRHLRHVVRVPDSAPDPDLVGHPRNIHPHPVQSFFSSRHSRPLQHRDCNQRLVPPAPSAVKARSHQAHRHLSLQSRLNSTVSPNPEHGCPTSRVFCEKWGFLSKPSPVPRRSRPHRSPGFSAWRPRHPAQLAPPADSTGAKESSPGCPPPTKPRFHPSRRKNRRHLKQILHRRQLPLLPSSITAFSHLPRLRLHHQRNISFALPRI